MSVRLVLGAAGLSLAFLSLFLPASVPVPPEVRLALSGDAAAPGEIHLDLTLERPGSGRAGLGVALFWDSRRLEFAGLAEVLQSSLLGPDATPEDDTRDLDRDPSTDRLVRLAWAEVSGEWSGARDGARLARAVFRRLEVDPGRGSTRIAAVSLSQAPGYRFATTRLPVPLEAVRSQGGRRSLPAGRRTPLEGERVEAVRTLSAGTVHHRQPRVGRQASTESPALCSLDVDADGLADALTDGVLILRRLFGFSGTALVTGAVAPSASRSDGEELDQYLQNLPCRAMQDADGNGQLDALTDGVLILRYLFGFTGDPLAAGAVGTGASRVAGTSVAGWLALYLNLYATVELSAPVLEAPLYAGIPARMDVGVRYTGTLTLAFSLEQGPAGMSIVEESGELRWTPLDGDEGAAAVVRVRATDQEATAEVEFALQVAETTPLQTQTEDRTVRVTEPGTLQGFAVTLGADSPSLPGDLEFGGLTDEWTPPLPPGVIRLSGFFKLTGWEREEDPARVQLPLYGLPAGRFLDEVQLFVYSEALHHLGRPSWAPLGVFPELTANGEVVVDLWSLPGLAFVGLAERPETAAGSERKSRPQGKRGPDEPAHQSGITCQPHAVLLGGFELYRFSEAQICDVASPPLTVWVYGYDPETITWVGGPPALEEVVGWLAESREGVQGLGLDSDKEFIVKFETIECDSGGGCLYGFVHPAENYFVLHLADTWREGQVERPGVASANSMAGTAAHEYFHQAQARTRVPGRTNAMDTQVMEWVVEATAEWFMDEVFDDRDTMAERLPLPPVLEAGLASQAGQVGTVFDPYSRFAFWKMLFSEETRRCPGFALRDLFNSPVVSGDSYRDAITQFVNRLGPWQCDFGPGFGAGASTEVKAALVRYSMASLLSDRMDLLDADETLGNAFELPDSYVPDTAESQRLLSRKRELPKLGAQVFRLSYSESAYTLRLVKGSSPETLWVLVLARDGTRLQGDGWSAGSDPIVGSENLPYVWTELTETRTLEVPVSEGSTPRLVVAVVNPSLTRIADYTVEVLIGTRASGELYQVDPIAGNLRFVKALTFQQGLEGDTLTSKPFEHTLTRDMAVMETEVTRQMWADLKAAQPSLPADPTSYFIEFEVPQADSSLQMDSPVTYVTWYEAVLFANLLSLERGFPRVYYVNSALTQPVTAANYLTDVVFEDPAADGYRLPSEGEWEFFTRAGSSTHFWVPGADASGCSSAPGAYPALEAAAWFIGNWGGEQGFAYTHPVGQKLKNPWNLSDVHGNVGEWVWDNYAFYPTTSQTDYRGPTENICSGGYCRILRGQALNGNPCRMRSGYRNAYQVSPIGRSPLMGFRLVRTIP